MDADAVVIGAGSTGLALLRALGANAVCVERGSDVGGLWRYENDNGLSCAYASLRTNVSLPRMQYPSFPMPETFGDFPHHTDMAAYLGSYADAFGLRERIRFGTTVERLEPQADDGWVVTLGDGSSLRARAAVVAVGHDWCPRVPEYPGGFDGEVLHAHDYRMAEPFAGRRVLVVGAGQSAAEIAVELSEHAAHTCLAIRSPVHVVPRRIGGTPYDTRDAWPANRLPWPLLNRLFAREVERELGPLPTAWPVPNRRLLEELPTLSSELLPAVRRGAVGVRPGIERLGGDRVPDQPALPRAGAAPAGGAPAAALPAHRPARPRRAVPRRLRGRAERAAADRGGAGRLDRRGARGAAGAAGDRGDAACDRPLRAAQPRALPERAPRQHPLRPARVPAPAARRPAARALPLVGLRQLAGARDAAEEPRARTGAAGERVRVVREGVRILRNQLT
jgi:hypothetical protein